MDIIRVVTIFKQQGPNYKKKQVQAPSFLCAMKQWLEQRGQSINFTQTRGDVGLSSNRANNCEFEGLKRRPELSFRRSL